MDERMRKVLSLMFEQIELGNQLAQARLRRDTHDLSAKLSQHVQIHHHGSYDPGWAGNEAVKIMNDITYLNQQFAKNAAQIIEILNVKMDGDNDSKTAFQTLDGEKDG